MPKKPVSPVLIPSSSKVPQRALVPRLSGSGLKRAGLQASCTHVADKAVLQAPATDSHLGQAMFLSALSVLEDELLPRLNAVNLFRLSSTCKALQGWILATPPTLWQVRTTVTLARSMHSRINACIHSL